MADQQTPQRDLGRYFALAQTGAEMVVPIGLGALADHYLGWTPWATVAGAVLGLVGGLTHMLVMLRRIEERRGDDGRPKPN